jgi:hypothetical protein
MEVYKHMQMKPKQYKITYIFSRFRSSPRYSFYVFPRHDNCQAAALVPLH